MNDADPCNESKSMALRELQAVGKSDNYYRFTDLHLN